MSFGFGVGDFITVIELANKVRKRFVNAPEQLRAVVEEVKSLSNVLRDVEDASPEWQLTVKQSADLKEVLLSCTNVLSELDKVLNNYSELQDYPKPHSLSKKSKK